MRVLLVEDDVRLAGVMRRGLAESGHVVEVEHDGVAGEKAALAGDYDAIVFDVMLPGKDGISAVRDLRRARVRTPILILTARDRVEDTIAGLDAGADDYVRKPFVFGELEARLRAIVRRAPEHPRALLRVGDLEFDLSTRRATRGDRAIELTARETAFLEYFMRNAGIVVSRTMLEDALWERERDTSSNVIEVYVRRLRGKLCAKGEPPLIETIRGAGYRFGVSTDARP